MSDTQLRRLVRTIVASDDAVVFALLATKPGLVKAHFEDGATRQIAKPYHIDEIGHYVYSGDTALHIAAASYREEIARKLIAMGADVRARNRRGAGRLRLRGPCGAQFEFTLAAIAQNLRRLAKLVARPPPLPAPWVA